MTTTAAVTDREHTDLSCECVAMPDSVVEELATVMPELTAMGQPACIEHDQVVKPFPTGPRPGWDWDDIEIHREVWFYPDLGEPYSSALCGASDGERTQHGSRVTCGICLRIRALNDGRWPRDSDVQKALGPADLSIPLEE